MRRRGLIAVYLHWGGLPSPYIQDAIRYLNVTSSGRRSTASTAMCFAPSTCCGPGLIQLEARESPMPHEAPFEMAAWRKKRT
jgi:hypothetical protein